jgi:hypothetical protein
MIDCMAKDEQDTPARRLQRRLDNADARLIDELYGLEPVYEPGEGGAALGAFAEFLCPYCSETIGTPIDLTDGSRVWIEDCQVCCQPMQITIEVSERGELGDVTAERMD